MTIFCVARNYVAHANEMGNPVPEKPVVFMKPPAALLLDDKPFHLPEHSQHIDYETELVLRICRSGRNISEAEAPSFFDSVAVGIDFTARDIQNACKEKGWPWEIAKSFDESGAVSEFFPKDHFGQFSELTFALSQNGKEVQQGKVSEMLFPVARLISYISSMFTITEGDLLFTGTPFGVGKVEAGDLLEASIAGRKLLTCNVLSPA